MQCLNESLPIYQRLGQIGMSDKYGEMKIVGYRNTTDIDVFFKEYNQIAKHRRYDRFLKGALKPDLKLAREGKIKKANNGQWMRLLIYNDCENCVVEFEDGTLVDCRYSCFDNGQVANPNYIKPSENEFYYNDKLECWVGVTKKGEEFLFSHPDERVIEYVKSYTWRKTNYDYFQNKKGERLHRVIMNVLKNKDIYINHIGGNRYDNRWDTLSISNPLDNSKEKKKSSRNTSGVVGLVKRGRQGKYIGSLKINGIGINTAYKIKNEALIDLLIVQKEYGFRHNKHLFYLIENVSYDRKKEVLDNVKRQLIEKTKKEKQVICRNEYVLSNDKTYYNVYDSKRRCFQISKELKSKIRNGNWYVAEDKQHSKKYVQGEIIYNNTRKHVKLHRYIFDLIDKKYQHIYVDHLDGNGLNNKNENLILTDANGNGKNKPAQGYHIRKSGNFRGSITINGKRHSKTFKTKKEAIEWYDEMREFSMKNRKTFSNKEEVDNYIESLNSKIA